MSVLAKLRFNPLIFKWTQKNSKLFTLHLIRNFIFIFLFLCLYSNCIKIMKTHSVTEEFHEYHKGLTYPITEADVAQLETYVNNPYLPDYEKGICSETIYSYYFFSPDYIKAVEYVGHALFYFERCQDYYSIANSRFTLVLAMNSFHAFNNAERILHEILEIEISNQADADTIRYYSYVNLADIYSQTDRVKEALFYLEEAQKLSESLSNLHIEYSYMMEIIKARCYFLQGDSKKSEAILTLLPDNLLENSTPFLNLYVSYLDILSMVLLENGNTKEALQISQNLVNYCSTHNYGNVQLKHLYAITELCHSKGINTPQLDSYQELIAEMSPVLIQQRSEDMAVFMKYAYDSLSRSMLNLIQINELKDDSFVQIICFLIVAAILLIALKRIKDKGRIDGLTGVYNRRHFNYIYDGFQINHLPFSIIILDVDNFKSCNDVYGHEFGDEVLIGVCNCVEACLSQNTHLFRYGGEEFCVFCPYTTSEQTAKLAEKIRKKVESRTWDKDTSITISLGVADSFSHENPLTLADERLYTSKHTGKNKVTWQ